MRSVFARHSQCVPAGPYERVSTSAYVSPESNVRMNTDPHERFGSSIVGLWSEAESRSLLEVIDYVFYNIYHKTPSYLTLETSPRTKEAIAQWYT
jgi:hypothetical protein